MQYSTVQYRHHVLLLVPGEHSAEAVRKSKRAERVPQPIACSLGGPVASTRDGGKGLDRARLGGVTESVTATGSADETLSSLPDRSSPRASRRWTC